METIDDILKHYGVKGMKWGVRRDKLSKGKSSKSTSTTKTKEPSRLKKELSSLQRERKWKDVLREVNEMTTKDIRKVASRVQLENDLKRLSKNRKISSKKDKEDYLRRANMSTQELSRKVNRLRAKEALHRNVMDATRRQRELGMKIVSASAQLGIKGLSGQKITDKDILSALRSNPKQVKGQLTDLTGLIADRKSKQ